MRAHLILGDLDPQSTIARALGAEWFTIEAPSVADAIANLSEAVDVMFVAATLPQRDELLDAVRASAETRHVPVVLVVTSDHVDSGACVDDYLRLPAPEHEIRSRASMLAEVSRMRAAAYRNKNEFLTHVGHELRNPLSALQAMVQALALREPSPPVDLMARSVEEMTKLVDNMLEVSRLARGMVKLQRRAIELADVMDRAIEMCSALLGARKLTVSVPRAGLLVDADPDRLAKVFANVIANAAQHSETSLPITIDAQEIGDRVQISIKDRGVGVAPERVATIFESFRTPKTGSLSVGLAIARSLVELHGGSIHLASGGVGQGTEVSIDLPITARSTAMPTDGRKRLLLIEDNDDAASVLKSALEQLGYSVVVAHNGPVALSVATSFDPDVALVDLNLPVMDGWELAKRLRSRDEALHFVAVTAYDQDTDVQRSRDLGFADHLVKPIDLGRLEKVVASLAAKSRP